jgi:hypothetical protein
MNPMINMRWVLIVLLGVALAGRQMAAETTSATPNQTGVALTVYDRDLSVVRDARRMPVTAGTNTVRFADVAARIELTSVQLRSLTDPQMKVLEQRYAHDLATADSLLQRYLGRQLTVQTSDGARYTGQLVGFDDRHLFVRQFGERGDLIMIQRPGNVRDIQFGALPDGVVSRPTLIWQVVTGRGGEQVMEVVYHTGGLEWRADYTAILDETETRLELTGRVSVSNASGATYKDARLRLQARESASAGSVVIALEQPVTLGYDESRRIELLRASEVAARTVYLYEGAPGQRFEGVVQTDPAAAAGESDRPVARLIEFANTAENRLGMLLPGGTMRFYKRAAAEPGLEFIGEGPIGHTAPGEVVRAGAGEAGGLAVERARTAFEIDAEQRTILESFELTLRNRRPDPLEVIVREPLHRAREWEILRASHEHEQHDAQTIQFRVHAPARGQTRIAYTARYRW